MKTTLLTATAVTALNPTDIDYNKLWCYKPEEHNSLRLQDYSSDLKMKRGQAETSQPFQPCFAISVRPFGEI
jgi:hypothetical protein